MNRRTFLQRFSLTLGALWTAAIVYPVFRYLNRPPDEVKEESQMVVATQDEVSPGQSKRFQFNKRAGLLIRDDAGNYMALDATCTHLSCTVQHRPEKKDIFCACHEGVYDLKGKNVSGPPPKPLNPIKVSVADNGDVIISKV